MVKLPLLLSVFKKTNDNTLYLLNLNINFKCSLEYENYINYKIYDAIEQKENSYIRNHIKQLRGIHSNDLAKINKNVIEENKKLLEKNTCNIKKIDDLKNKIEELTILKNILQEKYIKLEENYEKLYNQNNINKQKYIEKLCIINSNINEIIINEKKNIFE